jgi:hypothetical protein
MRLYSRTPGRHTMWECQCDCGISHLVRKQNLTNGNTRSCGCLGAISRALSSRTHGATVGKKQTPEYRTWTGIKKRCENQKAKSWKRYGGRGIKVCQRWQNSFAAFLEDVGERPTPKHSLDRFPNNDGDYEPGNVRWATATQQSRNRSTSRIHTAFGITGTTGDLAESFQIPRSCVQNRLQLGWPIEAALTVPVKGPQQYRGQANITAVRNIDAALRWIATRPSTPELQAVRQILSGGSVGRSPGVPIHFQIWKGRM